MELRLIHQNDEDHTHVRILSFSRPILNGSQNVDIDEKGTFPTQTRESRASLALSLMPVSIRRSRPHPAGDKLDKKEFGRRRRPLTITPWCAGPNNRAPKDHGSALALLFFCKIARVRFGSSVPIAADLNGGRIPVVGVCSTSGMGHSSDMPKCPSDVCSCTRFNLTRTSPEVREGPGRDPCTATNRAIFEFGCQACSSSSSALASFRSSVSKPSVNQP